MKCLSVKQPWAALIVSGEKDVENRSWATMYRGRVLIHASASPDRTAVLPKLTILRGATRSSKTWQTKLNALKAVTGAIIGSVELYDCVPSHPSRWADKHYAWHWLLRDAEMFRVPMPYSGKLKLYDVDDDLLSIAMTPHHVPKLIERVVDRILD